ncbi:MAG: nucleoid-associated protein EbfC [Moorella sp. (in: firmicutes)]|nr:nucleoid-associated protein EbfC [Moorella sp. (in: firmicutes)]MDK2895411.1 nucleoid-associated protein EbfC [Moorella sp. (in: firmicutes)]GEA14491.1 nucleoid-associated protein [Moorella sp. E308F]GEA18137.1 nucleoid-associated protein [Moorella sp. E306M]
MGMNNINKMMKQMQKMQAQIAKLQDELGEKTVEAAAGGGAVVATANGRQEIVGIKIDPAAVDPDDVEMLQDLILAAVNEALRQSQEMAAREMGKITGNMRLPGF